MAKQTKNQKYGRNTRSTSGKLQAKRSEKNKMKAIEAAKQNGDKMAGVQKWPVRGEYASKARNFVSVEARISFEKALTGNRAKEMLEIYERNGKTQKDLKNAYPKTFGLVLQ
jgi:hypothetical protein